MSITFNKIQIVGRIGRDPELRYTPDGKLVSDFSVAINKRHKDTNGNTKEESLWFKVTFWGEKASFASQYLKKGRLIYIDGELRFREYTDRNGQIRGSLEVLGHDFKMIDSRPDERHDEEMPTSNEIPVEEVATVA